MNRVSSGSAIKRRWAIDRQQLLILLATAVMLTSFCLLVVWPRHCELQDLGWILTHERERVSEKVRMSQDGLYVSARLAALRGLGDRLEDRMPDEPRLAEYLQVIDDSVRAEAGVTYDIQLAPVGIDAAVATVPIRLRLVGPYEGVYRSLAAMERQERLTRFEHVRVHRSEGGKEVVAEVEIRIYHLPSTEEAAAVPKTEVASL
jgi:hypothetical protein